MSATIDAKDVTNALGGEVSKASQVKAFIRVIRVPVSWSVPREKMVI